MRSVPSDARLPGGQNRLSWKSPLEQLASVTLPRRARSDREPSATGAEDVAYGHQAGIIGACVRLATTDIQDKWFARLYLLKPVMFIVLSAFWVATAIISLTVGYLNGLDLMRGTGVGFFSGPAVVAGALGDIAIGISIAWRP